MPQLTHDELRTSLTIAKQQVPINSTRYHYKKTDKQYRIIDIVINTQDDQPMIIYQTGYDDAKDLVFARPYSERFDPKQKDGKQVTRFTKVDT